MAAASGHPVRQGTWGNLKVVVFGTAIAEGTYVANRIEVPFTLETDDGAADVAQAVFEVRVSDVDMGAASSTAVIYAADTSVGTIIEGSGTAAVRVQMSTSGTLTLAVEETSGSAGAPAYRYLSIRPTYGTAVYLRPSTGSLALQFT